MARTLGFQLLPELIIRLLRPYLLQPAVRGSSAAWERSTFRRGGHDAAARSAAGAKRQSLLAPRLADRAADQPQELAPTPILCYVTDRRSLERRRGRLARPR